VNVQIYDAKGEHIYASWAKGEFNDLTYQLERIGGMISASFRVPCEYTEPYPWAKRRNQVQVYSDGGVCVFDGYIHDLSRYWNEKDSGIKVDVVGWVAKLARDYVSASLANEKASTYLAAHVLVGMFADYVSTGELDTDDYLIPGRLDFSPQKTKRAAIDEIYPYNLDTHEWGVWEKEFYWRKVADSLSYRTTVYGGCTGEIRQGCGEQAQKVRLVHRDMAGAWQAVVATDADADDGEYILITLDDNMSTAQATRMAEAELERAKKAGTNAPIKITRLWGKSGEMDVAEAKPGLILAVAGIVPGEASIAEADIDNDLDTWCIESIKYSAETGVADAAPGRLPYNLPTVIGGTR